MNKVCVVHYSAHSKSRQVEGIVLLHPIYTQCTSLIPSHGPMATQMGNPETIATQMGNPETMNHEPMATQMGNPETMDHWLRKWVTQKLWTNGHANG